MSELTGGRTITIYGQNRVVEDLIAARRAPAATLHYEVSDVSLHDLDERPPDDPLPARGPRRDARMRRRRRLRRLPRRQPRRRSRPASCTEYEREYPFGWLGILAEVAPSTDELIYAYHERGFALHSLRSPEISRLYIQVPRRTRTSRRGRTTGSGPSCTSGSRVTTAGRCRRGR